jgi:hypothetical protein
VLSAAPLAAALADAELAYLAVESPSGPMVTPLLFAVQDERLWMVMPRSSAKVAAIEADARVGLAVGRAGDLAVVQGEAHLVDPLRPSALVSSLPEALLAPRALGRYLTGNLDHLAGILGGAGTGLLSPRTVAALRPQRALVVRPGAPWWSAGTWPEGARPYTGGDGAPRPSRLPLDGVPDALRSLPSTAGPVVLGWTTTAGPVALPATWDAAMATVQVDAALFAATGCLPQSRACVLFDGTEGTALDGKSGLVLRGRGSAAAAHGAGADGAATVTVRTERLSWWHGTDSRSVKAG